MIIKTNDPDVVTKGLKSEVDKIATAVLSALTEHVYAQVVQDYTRRLQLLHYPLRNPKTKEILDSMPPQAIARVVQQTITQDSSYVYIPPGTEADKSARMQELYGGKPWQSIRIKMRDFDYVNAALAEAGLRGIRAKAIV